MYVVKRKLKGNQDSAVPLWDEGDGVSHKSRAFYLKPDDLTLGKMKSLD